MGYIKLAAAFLLALSAVANAQLPPPPSSWSPWPTKITTDQPGELSADAWLDKPAARNGPIVIRDGHFYSGNSRIRFWGVNLAFSANFPTHDQADMLARRFARYGINAVRFHHMDNQPFPNGIFADSSLVALSPMALDRLDYFISVLKQQGIYADLNLHVSRNYNHYHKTADGKDGPRGDKMVDLFDPELIAAQKQYASDLLNHVNAYTHARYADEPAVAIVEINNENSFFMWSAEQTLANFPAVYADEMTRQWNRWLLEKYGSREKLKSAWAIGEEPTGESILPHGDFESNGWIQERHGGDMTVNFDHGAAVDVTAVDGTSWHLQLGHPGLKLKAGAHYTASFTAQVEQPRKIAVEVSQAHEPWTSDGLGAEIQLDPNRTAYSFPFTVSQSDDNARLTFVLGDQTGRITLNHVKLIPGGVVGLTDAEDPAKGTVQRAPPQLVVDAARSQDWYTFLQETEQNYYVGMMNYLKTDIGVKCPITGTIGFGPLGTLSQSKMDFVDAHAYWEHPSFPHKQWDMSDWMMPNQAMVDHPDKPTLWGLATTRVAGKPFTVTEYQHPAPNDWQAECIPFIATFAGLQDWDGAFLFAYSHSSDYDNGKIESFFNLEGNPTKMPLMPMGARLFEMVRADESNSRMIGISRAQVLKFGSKFSMNLPGFIRSLGNPALTDNLEIPTSISFDGAGRKADVPSTRTRWTANGPGTGRFVFGDANAAVFIGFSAGPMPLDLLGSNVRIESMQTPFATIIVAPAASGQTISNTDRLLITAVARAQNADMQWNENRTSVSNHWGTAPPQIEVVQATLSLPGKWSHALALDANGKPTGGELAEIQGDRTIVKLGINPAIGYVISR